MVACKKKWREIFIHFCISIFLCFVFVFNKPQMFLMNYAIAPLQYLPVQDLSLPSGRVEFERLLRESQMEVLRLQRQLSVTSCGQQDSHNPDPSGPEKCEVIKEVDEGEQKVKSSS